jgi:hypothetical protein
MGATTKAVLNMTGGMAVGLAGYNSLSRRGSLPLL